MELRRRLCCSKIAIFDFTEACLSSKWVRLSPVVQCCYQNQNTCTTSHDVTHNLSVLDTTHRQKKWCMEVWVFFLKVWYLRYRQLFATLLTKDCCERKLSEPKLTTTQLKIWVWHQNQCHQYLSCCFPDFNQTLNVSLWDQ